MARSEDRMHRSLMIAVLVATAYDVQGQGLGDAAAKERARRAKIENPKKTFTESDLEEAGHKRAQEGSPAGAASPSPSLTTAARPVLSASPEPVASEETTTSPETKRARAAQLKAQMIQALDLLRQFEADVRKAEENYRVVEGLPAIVSSTVRIDGKTSLEMARGLVDSAKDRLVRVHRVLDTIQDNARREGIPMQQYMP
jgi:hypothetical protein